MPMILFTTMFNTMYLIELTTNKTPFLAE